MFNIFSKPVLGIFRYEYSWLTVKNPYLTTGDVVGRSAVATFPWMTAFTRRYYLTFTCQLHALRQISSRSVWVAAPGSTHFLYALIALKDYLWHRRQLFPSDLDCHSISWYYVWANNFAWHNNKVFQPPDLAQLFYLHQKVGQIPSRVRFIPKSAVN